MHKKCYYLQFAFDSRGYGNLELHNDSLIALSIPARTGSINSNGTLVNAIYNGIWTIRDIPVDTEEPGMVWEAGKGWKVRLYTPGGIWSHFLIHPDGGKKNGNGTAGCIGLQGTYEILRADIDKILTMQDKINVYINTEVCDEMDTACI